jgi:hypothetical protein
MNPHILFSAAKVAYNNRDVAINLLSKIREWKKSANQTSDKKVIPMSPEDRLDRLESHADSKDLLDEAQSELIAGLAANLAELSTTTQILLARTKLLIWLIVISICLSIAALIVSTT